jgi:alpha-L-fucosidase
VVVTAKELKSKQNSGIVEDFERGFTDDIKQYPWQTCTCIGDWHYNREVFVQKKYKTVGQVVHQLIDIVSKNGNLLLSIPIRGDGTIDELEMAFLEGMEKWMNINGEAIFGTRPWKIYGEGPTQIKAGMFNEGSIKFTEEDIRFTTKGNTLYAFILGWPGNKSTLVKSFSTQSSYLEGRTITNVSLMGYQGKLDWIQNEEGLSVKMPVDKPCEDAFVLKIDGILGK